MLGGYAGAAAFFVGVAPEDTEAVRARLREIAAGLTG